MKKLSISLFVLGIFLAFGVGRASAATWYVDNTLGTDTALCGVSAGVSACKTMQYTDTNIASNGDTVYVQGGETYTEVNSATLALILAKSVTWIAVNGIVTITNDGSTKGSAATIEINGNNIVLEGNCSTWSGAGAVCSNGFIVDGAAYSTTLVTWAASKTGTLIRDTTLQNMSSAGTWVTFAGGANTGIQLTHSTFSTTLAPCATTNFHGCMVEVAAVVHDNDVFNATTNIFDWTASTGTTTLTNSVVNINASAAQDSILVLGAAGTHTIGGVGAGNTFNVTNTNFSLITGTSAAGLGDTISYNQFNVSSTSISINLFYWGTGTPGTTPITFTHNTVTGPAGCSGASCTGEAGTPPTGYALLNIKNQTGQINVSYNTVLDNWTAGLGNNYYGFYLTANNAAYISAHPPVINYNTFTSNSLNSEPIGVGIDGSSSSCYETLPNGQIIGNVINMPVHNGGEIGSHCIEVAYQSNWIITDNKTAGGSYGLVLKGSSTAPTVMTLGKVNYNIFTGVKFFGLHVKGVQNVAAYNNTFSDNYQDDVGTIANEGNNSTGNVLKNNIMSHTPSSGGSSICTTSGNPSVCVDVGSASGFISNHNDIYVSGVGTYGAVGANYYSAWSGGGSWQNAGYDVNGNNANPLFVSPSNFYLTGGSVARGIADGSVLTGTASVFDINTTRITDAAGNLAVIPDIGAYQSQPMSGMGMGF